MSRVYLEKKIHGVCDAHAQPISLAATLATKSVSRHTKRSATSSRFHQFDTGIFSPPLMLRYPGPGHNMWPEGRSARDGCGGLGWAGGLSGKRRECCDRMATVCISEEILSARACE